MPLRRETGFGMLCPDDLASVVREALKRARGPQYFSRGERIPGSCITRNGKGGGGGKIEPAVNFSSWASFGV
jgi:hypothetical protein